MLNLAKLMIVNLKEKVAELVWNLVLGLFMFALNFADVSLVGVNFRMTLPDEFLSNQRYFGFLSKFLKHGFLFCEM